MYKIPLLKLKDKVFRRISILALIGLEDLLSIDERVGGDEVFIEIISQSLETFEYYHPLCTHLNVYIQPDQGSYEFKSNFHGYLAGNLAEDQIELVPTEIIGITRSHEYPGTYLKDFYYERPYIKLLYLAAGLYKVKGYFRRPMIINYTPERVLTGDSAIYYLDDDLREAKSSMFLNQCCMDIGKYFWRLRENFNLQLPVDMFIGMQTMVSELETKLDAYYVSNTIKDGNYIT